MLACLFHYNLDVSLVQHVVERISPHVDSYLIPHFIRVMTAGCPNVMNAESARENSVKYWRAGNNPAIAKHLPAVMKTMNKEERNKFVIPLPMWITNLFRSSLFMVFMNKEERNKFVIH